MNASAAVAVCGPYVLVAQDPDSLFELADGSVELYAERSYLVKLGAGAVDGVLRGALRVPKQASEGMLRFENFVGIAELGGRRLHVRSDRIDAEGVEEMLDEVCDRLASLPFRIDASTSAAYERVKAPGPDALYHAFVFLRDSMRGLGPHDLREAIGRILARPHESLCLGDPRLDPVGAADRLDGETLEAIQREPELLSPVAAGSPLSSHPLTRSLQGTMPEFVRSRPVLHSTDNPENRFVSGALDSMIELLRRFERLARHEERVSSAINAKEARELANALSRFRRHRALEAVHPTRKPPLQSTVLRMRPGYREILRIWSDLNGRTAWGARRDAQLLLEMRDAGAIYEYWCYFQVVTAMTRVLGEPASSGRFAADVTGTRVPYGCSAEWPEASVTYNETFPHSSSSAHWPGSTSYSLSLRPDISLRTQGGRLHVFDAKLKIGFGKAMAGNSGEEQVFVETFRSEDLHKMHAYRDALGAESVWVLYPGDDPRPAAYPVPPRDAVAGGAFGGVGAVALCPGGEHDGGLANLVSGLL